MGAALLLAAGVLSTSVEPPVLPASTRFLAPGPPSGSQAQITQLAARGDRPGAELIRRMVDTPRAVWFTGGTPEQVESRVRHVVAQADASGTAPVLVAYNIPHRDCGEQPGAGGSDAAYHRWANGFSLGLLDGQRVIVVVEPDALASLPSDCASAVAGRDVKALTAARFVDIQYVAKAVTRRDGRALVYLDAGHVAWRSVGEMSRRLVQAGIGQVQGFALNVANYQDSVKLAQYGNAIARCLADAGSCPGPPPTWQDRSPAPNAHFVIDTSRNGMGPWNPPASSTYPNPQTWCNAPQAGLGARPRARPRADTPLLDAYLWIKTPGESDGRCSRGIPGTTGDPEWAAITGRSGFADPVAGAWFPAQARQLAERARPPLR